MNPTTQQLISLCCFVLYLFIQGLAINGIFISARGKDYVMPDGTIEKGEMIFYPIYRFLTQYTMLRVQFTYAEIKRRNKGNVWPVLPDGSNIDWNKEQSPFTLNWRGSGPVVLDSVRTWAERYLDAEIEYDANENTVAIFQQHEKYRFSKYIRKPIIQCVVCMSSFWSIPLFLVPVILLFGITVKIFFIWALNILCLSFVNYLIFKPLS